VSSTRLGKKKGHSIRNEEKGALRWKKIISPWKTRTAKGGGRNHWVPAVSGYGKKKARPLVRKGKAKGKIKPEVHREEEFQVGCRKGIS